ncbi:MAG TPA: redoxin domain-containing protein [Jiangellaceae bacterium]
MTKKRPAKRRGQRLQWVAFFAPALAIAGIIIAAGALSGSDDEPTTAADAAPDFTLTDTEGDTVQLAEVLEERDALLYFSMGVGCDGCFLQIPEIAAELKTRDIEFLPIMVDRADWLAAEAERLQVGMPIVVDPDRSVSEAYDMVGQHGHGDRPSHSFALVRQSGELAWVRHYVEMFVPSEQFFAEMPG